MSFKPVSFNEYKNLTVEEKSIYIKEVAYNFREKFSELQPIDGSEIFKP